MAIRDGSTHTMSASPWMKPVTAYYIEPPVHYQVLVNRACCGSQKRQKLPRQGMKTGMPRSRPQAEAPAAGALLRRVAEGAGSDLDGQLRHNGERQRCSRGSVVAQRDWPCVVWGRGDLHTAWDDLEVQSQSMRKHMRRSYSCASSDLAFY